MGIVNTGTRRWLVKKIAIVKHDDGAWFEQDERSLGLLMAWRVGLEPTSPLGHWLDGDVLASIPGQHLKPLDYRHLKQSDNLSL